VLLENQVTERSKGHKWFDQTQ